MIQRYGEFCVYGALLCVISWLMSDEMASLNCSMKKALDKLLYSVYYAAVTLCFVAHIRFPVDSKRKHWRIELYLRGFLLQFDYA